MNEQCSACFDFGVPQLETASPIQRAFSEAPGYTKLEPAGRLRPNIDIIINP